MGSLLDQIKGGMSKPKKASRAGGSKAKKSVPKRIKFKHASGKTAKARVNPRMVRRERTSKTLRRGR
tara:strand:+ start:749 stop:949 length:201 start_codon:yes stop_codon:yes gene_type:complete